MDEDADLCTDCGKPRHWCQGKDGECGLETGHYGQRPAKYCDDCRYGNIMVLGIAGDEPPNIATDYRNGLNEIHGPGFGH